MSFIWGGLGHWQARPASNGGILDVSPGELRRQLAYKTTWYGFALAVAERW